MLKKFPQKSIILETRLKKGFQCLIVRLDIFSDFLRLRTYLGLFEVSLTLKKMKKFQYPLDTKIPTRHPL